MVAINNIIALTSVTAFASAAALPEANWWGAPKPSEGQNPTWGPKPSKSHPAWGPKPTKSHPTWGPNPSKSEHHWGPPTGAPFPSSNGTFPHHSQGHAQPTGHHSFVLPTKSWPSAFPSEWPTEFTGAFPTGWPTAVPTDISNIESIINEIWEHITSAIGEDFGAAPSDAPDSQDADFLYASSSTITL
ncbi:Serine/threonine-protein kinase [Wickerhamomyces ciferrii]|uniref:Serine/threonine-protein kinase n=1 Tax=Wickerhamomyces ciferrii (strain ATCC 14091 / BCRC 22168 / CBS 111 / JCM 3599 / NBRC 0793 / NRRL Y-1031 F-60-10) TaxID=1206466 RepID=K0KB09_WICCF|nr:Serine/threonine-protein kinase [Wickerhamomyces ciferrii]CCH42185.1 Serine/threonine-protein kinase [Wickerhamomyces ciferrii]